MEHSPHHLLHRAWRASRGGLVSVLLFGAFINLLKFTMPLYTLQLLDRIPSSRSVETLVMLTLIALLAVAAGVALEAVRKRMFTHWGGWLEDLFGPALAAEAMAGSSTNSPGEGLRDLRALRAFVERAAAPLLDLMWAPLFVVAVYLVHPLMGAVMLGAILLRLVLAVLQETAVRESRRAAGNAQEEARDMLANARRQADTVGALGMTDSLSRRWRDNMATRLHQSGRVALRNDIAAALGQGLYRTLYVSGMGLGVWLLILDELTIGGVIAGNIIMRFGYRLVDRGARRWRMLGRAKLAYRRLKGQLTKMSGKSAAETSLDPADLTAALTLEQVAYRYQGARQSILKRLDMQLEPGELLSIMGPSGSGKSTLARLLVGSLPPTRGQLLLGNTAVSRLPDLARARSVGYLPQEPDLFEGTVRENIARLDLGDLGEVMDAAKLAGIHEFIIRLPQGYDTPLDKEACGLSGGERKRIALARAFYRRPHLVVLDEPEAGLDRGSRRILRQALQNLRRGGSILVITTQSGRLARSADRCLILGSDSPRLVAGQDAAAPLVLPTRLADHRRRTLSSNGPDNLQICTESHP